MERRDKLLGRLPIVRPVAVLKCTDETQGQRLEAVVRKEFLNVRRLAAGDHKRQTVLPPEAIGAAFFAAQDGNGPGRLRREIELEQRPLADPPREILWIEAAIGSPIGHQPE